MFLVAYQCRMCEISQNENAASTTLKLNRGKSRVESCDKNWAKSNRKEI